VSEDRLHFEVRMALEHWERARKALNGHGLNIDHWQEVAGGIRMGTVEPAEFALLNEATWRAGDIEFHSTMRVPGLRTDWRAAQPVKGPARVWRASPLPPRDSETD
jgi:hypothetical protein